MAKAAGLTPAATIRIPVEPAPLSLGPPVSPPFDPAEILPPHAGEKLRQLRLRAAEAHALVPQFAQQQDARVELQRAEQWLKRLLDPASASDGGFHLHETDNRVEVAKKQVAKLTDDLKRLNDRSEARAKAWREASGALAACEAWLRDGRPRGVQLQDFQAEPVKLKGESLIDGIESRRQRVRELRADLARIEAAPLPSAYCKKKMREQVEQMSQRAPNVSNLIQRGDKIEFPMTQVRAMVHNATPGAVAYHDALDVVGLLAFLLKPTLIAALDRLIDEQAGDRASLSHEARQQRTAEVMGDLLAIEREESWLTWRAIDDRLPVEHRTDVNPIALLGLVLVATPHTVTSFETSPQWATSFAG